MASVLIRNLDEGVMRRLRAQAAKRRQSLEQRLREVMREAAEPAEDEIRREMAAIRGMTPRQAGRRLDFAAMIRSGRA
ncbi:MAG: hypothetical protein FJX47_17080, partial [Alphaproteobacteria bacterium]|nr:hypothetical protein [Alphaproteobacteria bacterium]